jgi:hypothetical protein
VLAAVAGGHRISVGVRDWPLLLITEYDQRVRSPFAVRLRALRAWLQAAAIHRGPVFRRMRRGDIAGA